MARNEPLVSVIMPTYNGRRWLDQAVGSVLNQTFRDLEVVLVDDGSTDGSADLAATFADDRVRLIRHERNRGIAASTNTAFEAARGRYLVMMDHDDISFPGRIARQVAFLEGRPELHGCGGGHVLMTRLAGLDTLKAVWETRTGRFVSDGEVAAETLFSGILFNPTMCFRRETLALVDHWFDGAYLTGGDVDFYERLVAGGARMAILPDVVLRYRRWSGSASRKNASVAKQNKLATSLRALRRLLPDQDPENERLHAMIVLRDRDLGPEHLHPAKEWFRTLVRVNEERRRFDLRMLLAVLGRQWSRVCALAACHDFQAGLRAYHSFVELRPYTSSMFYILYEWQKRKLMQIHKRKRAARIA